MCEEQREKEQARVTSPYLFFFHFNTFALTNNSLFR